MSESVRSHRRQPTRLPHPWDSPGKNTGLGCHFLLQCMKVKSESEFAQSCPALNDPMDCSLPGSSVHGIFQARVLEWGAIAFSDAFWQRSHLWTQGREGPEAAGWRGPRATLLSTLSPGGGHGFTPASLPAAHLRVNRARGSGPPPHPSPQGDAPTPAEWNGLLGFLVTSSGPHRVAAATDNISLWVTLPWQSPRDWPELSGGTRGEGLLGRTRGWAAGALPSAPGPAERGRGRGGAGVGRPELLELQGGVLTPARRRPTLGTASLARQPSGRGTSRAHLCGTGAASGLKHECCVARSSQPAARRLSPGRRPRPWPRAPQRLAASPGVGMGTWTKTGRAPHWPCWPWPWWPPRRWLCTGLAPRRTRRLRHRHPQPSALRRWKQLGQPYPRSTRSVALLRVTARCPESQALQDVARGVQLQRAPRIRSPWAAGVWLPQPPLPLRRQRGRGPVEGPWDPLKPSDVKGRRLTGQALLSRVGAKVKGHLHPSWYTSPPGILAKKWRCGGRQGVSEARPPPTG